MMRVKVFPALRPNGTELFLVVRMVPSKEHGVIFSVYVSPLNILRCII